MKNKDQEVTVQEASELLGVTTRSVLNYIKSKEIEAIKVGKSWYIKRPSLDSFSNRFGFSHRQKEQAQNNPNPTIDVRKDRSDYAQEEKSKKFSVKNLRAFKLTKEILGKSEVKEMIKETGLERKIEDHFHSALSHLGSGYYAFHLKDKIKLYERSRIELGAALALIYFSEDEKELNKKVLETLEDELLPAYSGLIKRLDNKNEKSKNI